MTRRIVLCAAVCLCALSNSLPAAEPKAKDNEAARDKKLLQGTWEAATVVVGGAMMVPGGKMIVKDDTMTYMHGAKEEVKFSFKLDPVPNPKQVDLTSEETADDKDFRRIAKNLGKDVPEFKPAKMFAIYAVNADGEQFVMCMAAPGVDRPTKLESNKGDKVRLVLYKRVKE